MAYKYPCVRREISDGARIYSNAGMAKATDLCSLRARHAPLHEKEALQDTFGHILTIVILLEFNHSIYVALPERATPSKRALLF
jgi:hypothetical protein